MSDQVKGKKVILNTKQLKMIAGLVEAKFILEIRNESSDYEDWCDLDLDVIKELTTYSEDIYRITLHKNEEIIELEFHKTETTTPENIVSDILSKLINEKHICQDDRVLIILDNSISKYNSTILVVDVNRVSYRIGKFNLAENMSSETILEAVLDVAQQIAIEGREGKKVGTLFVIGDEEELKDYTRQLIMNPFKGYEKEFCDITNLSLHETIKNFAQLDGGFIINKEGRVLSAGTYIDVDTSNSKAYAGWGTKHLAAVAITKETNSVSVLVSESGGRIKVFKNGKLMLRI